ncbi:MAG: cation diffusion facilitator family transporter [Planctomycetota bacterium]
MAGSSKKVIIAALIGNGLISVTKFVAAALTGSSAMLSEGIHSVVDTGNQVLLLHGLRAAKRPADSRFPFGHGKEIYFWSFVVAILIFAVGAGISIYEGIIHMLDPHGVENPTINYVVLGIAMIFEAGAWWFAYKEFQAIKGDRTYFEAVHAGKDPTMFVVLFEDTAAMLGLIVAFLGVLLGQLTGSALFDGAASIVIGLILAATAIWLAVETKSLLIGESAEPRVVKSVRAIADSTDLVERVNEVLTLHMGPEFILVTMSVDFVDTMKAKDIESTITGLDRRIKKEHPDIKRVFIEAEPFQSRGGSSAGGAASS